MKDLRFFDSQQIVNMQITRFAKNSTADKATLLKMQESLELQIRSGLRRLPSKNYNIAPAVSVVAANDESSYQSPRFGG
jgi:hypothetical protein